MSKKNKMYQVKEKKPKNDLFGLTLVGGYVSIKIDNIHEHLKEVNRGYGVVESKKTYNRKKNHQNTNNSDGSFYFTSNNIIFLEI